MELMNTIQEGVKGALDAAKDHHNGICTVTTIVAIGVFGFEVWTRKDSLKKTFEETKGQPFMKRAKAMAKDLFAIATPAAVAVSAQVINGVMTAKDLKTAGEKLQDMAALANTTAMAANAYEEATKETVGEEKAKEIKEKASQKELDHVQKTMPDATKPVVSGYDDIYYLSMLPGCNFPFNPDKERLLELFVNEGNGEYGDCARDIKKARNGIYREDQFTVEEFLDALEDYTQGVKIKRPNWEYDWGWDADEHISISSSIGETQDGRPCRILELYPKPHSLYSTMWNK